MRINKSYQAMFPNNCPVIEVTGDGVEVGTCTYYMKDGVCPRHGKAAQPVAEGWTCPHCDCYAVGDDRCEWCGQSRLAIA
jgi:hypothetical protein